MTPMTSSRGRNSQPDDDRTILRHLRSAPPDSGGDATVAALLTPQCHRLPKMMHQGCPNDPDASSSFSPRYGLRTILAEVRLLHDRFSQRYAIRTIGERIIVWNPYLGEPKMRP
jgi:hypothetical protein